jgi:hypothetical protein
MIKIFHGLSNMLTIMSVLFRAADSRLRERQELPFSARAYPAPNPETAHRGATEAAALTWRHAPARRSGARSRGIDAV